MYDILKAIATAQNWPFEYGRHDFQNLFDKAEQENTTHVFLDPVKTKDVDNDSGETEQKVYSGNFMLLYSSDIDEESYEYRYENYIKPIIEGALDTIKDAIRCDYEGSFDLWETTEVINVFDYNFDGVIVTYQVSVDV